MSLIIISVHSILNLTDRHTVSLMVVVGVYGAVIVKHAPESCKMGKISRSSPPASDIAHVEEGSGTIKTIAEAGRPEQAANKESLSYAAGLRLIISMSTPFSTAFEAFSNSILVVSVVM